MTIIRRCARFIEETCVCRQCSDAEDVMELCEQGLSDLEDLVASLMEDR